MHNFNCCIVERHCDIVPFIYALIRSKIAPLNSIILVHFDAHPDLMPVSFPHSFSDTKAPDRFMEILLEVGGISEFILPLIYNKYISSGNIQII